MSGSPLQRAARKRASQIRSMHMMANFTRLIDNPFDQATMLNIIDKQLASMGAETVSERQRRIRAFFDDPQSNMTDGEWGKEWKKIEQTAKPYKMTEEDIKRYDRW